MRSWSWILVSTVLLGAIVPANTSLSSDVSLRGLGPTSLDDWLKSRALFSRVSRFVGCDHGERMLLGATISMFRSELRQVGQAAFLAHQRSNQKERTWFLRNFGSLDGDKIDLVTEWARRALGSTEKDYFIDIQIACHPANSRCGEWVRDWEGQEHPMFGYTELRGSQTRIVLVRLFYLVPT